MQNLGPNFEFSDFCLTFQIQYNKILKIVFNGIKNDGNTFLVTDAKIANLILLT